MHIVLLIVRLLLAATFLIAGVSKLVGGVSTSRKALVEFAVPSWFAGSTSIALPWVELGIACVLLPMGSARIGALSAFGLLLTFCLAIAVNLSLGRRPRCNCFGQLHAKPIGWTTFGRNAILAALAGWAFWTLPHYPTSNLQHLFQGFGSKDLAFLLVTAILLAGAAFQGFLSVNLFRQNGRLLLRIEALETSRPPFPQAQPIRTVPASAGLPIGAKAISFDLPKVDAGSVTLGNLLAGGKPLLLVFTDPKCGPCNSLLPEIASWQQSLAADVNIALVSAGEGDTNRAKAVEHGLRNVLTDRDRKVAGKYKAFGTPSAVIVRGDGTIGSYIVGGADSIRQLMLYRAWTETGFAAFLERGGEPAQPQVLPFKSVLPLGSPAPSFNLPELSGETVNLASLRGKSTVLLFWNTACGFCQRMLPGLIEWETLEQSEPPRLVVVSSSPREANVEMGLKSTVVLDETFAVGRLYGANGTPSAVLIDAGGTIASPVKIGGPAVMELLSPKQRERSEPLALANAS